MLVAEKGKENNSEYQAHNLVPRVSPVHVPGSKRREPGNEVAKPREKPLVTKANKIISRASLSSGSEPGHSTFVVGTTEFLLVSKLSRLQLGLCNQ